jgi:hypothetical protein
LAAAIICIPIITSWLIFLRSATGSATTVATFCDQILLNTSGIVPIKNDGIN